MRRVTAYYNEIEPYAAEWLRNLIAEGLITPGDVDERGVHPGLPGREGSGVTETRRGSECMEIRDRIKELRRVKASELVADARNWRRHPRAQRSALQAMLERVGYVDAVIARDTPEGLVLADGHLRTDLAADSEIPVVVVDIDEQEAGEVLATLDPLAAMAEPDTDALDALVQGLAERADEALNGLLEEMHGLPGNSKPEEPLAATPEPRVQRGQVWQLGRHRVMCGDSTSAEDVARLLHGAKPRLMVTDPPYGVSYDTDWRNRALLGSRATGQVRNDERADWREAWALFPGDVAYVWHGATHCAVVQGSLEATGFTIRSQIVWAKERMVISRGHYHWQHEPCWYAVKAGATAGWIGDRTQSTVWDIANLNPWGGTDEEFTIHSTQKPLECMERPIRNHEGDVYDPFVGSGTTIIAAERQGRACYAMEIEPRYVDVAIARWEPYTGGRAEQVGQVGQ